MILDFNPTNGLYFLRVHAGEADPHKLMTEYGLNWSVASTEVEALLFTEQPYAAATFAEFATPAARDKMDWIVREIEASYADTSTSNFEVPDYDPEIHREPPELWNFQKADLDYMLRRERVLDADEPGLGKTPTAIVYANEIRARRVLVICPASIRFQWCNRIKQWSTMGQKYKVPHLGIYPIISSKDGTNPKAAWTVVSYELARHPAIHAALMREEFDLLICDEVHNTKEPGSKRSRAIWGGGLDPLYVEALADRCGRVVTLSGTPMPNRPREIFGLSRSVHHQAIDWMGEKSFYERFNPIVQIEVKKQEWDEDTNSYIERTVRVNDERCGRHAELQNRLRANYMCRHEKRRVLTQLKMPVYDLIQVEKTHAVKQALEVERLLDIDPDTLAGADATVLGHIAEARRIMGEALAPQVAKWLEMLIEGGEEKLVLFYWHISVGSLIERQLREFFAHRGLGENLVRVDGSTGAARKDTLRRKFIDDPLCRIIMGNVLSLGTGTDELQYVANHALICEPSWVPGENIQCFDRLDRGGQTRVVQGDIFVAPGSIAEKTLASSLRKHRNTHNALDRRVS
jgi:SWI/SNF-related matrix-associated actin-dependent regulator 1 of chromatin subfamily A